MENQQLEVIEKETQSVVEKAKSLTVTNQEQYNFTSEFLKGIKTLKKQIDATFDDAVKKAHEAHKAIVAAKKGHTDPLDEAERIIKQKVTAFITEQERIRQEEQRKIAEAARKEEERQRKIKEDQEKAWREKEEAQRKEAERLAAEGKAEEAAKAQAEADKAAAKAEERAQEKESVFVPVAEVESKITTAKGQSMQMKWRCEVQDVSALCRLIGEGKLSPSLVKLNDSALDDLAKAMNTVKFPGLRFYQEPILSARAR